MINAPAVIDTSHDETRSSRIDALAAAWLATFTGSHHTVNTMANSLGASPDVRRRLPGGPRQPRPADDTTWIGWCTINGVDPLSPMPHHIDLWLGHLAVISNDPDCRFTTSTRVHRFRAMANWLTWCVNRDHISPVRLPDLQERKRHHVTGDHAANKTRGLPADVVAALLWAAEHDDRTVSHKPGAATPDRRRTRSLVLFAILAGAGLRVSELTGLNVENYWRPEPTGIGYLRTRGKGGKVADQPVPPWAADLIDTYLADGRIGSHTTALAVSSGTRRIGGVPLVTGDRGQRMNRSVIADILIRLACLPDPDSTDQMERDHAAALARLPRTPNGCPNVFPHQLRHAAAHAVLDNNGDIEDVRRLLRHGSIATSQTYVESRATRADAISARLPRPGPEKS